MLEWLALAILSYYSLLAGPGLTLDKIDRQQWAIVEDVHKVGDHYTFTLDGSWFIDKCRADPGQYLVLPAVYYGFHTVRLDGVAVAVVGNPLRNTVVRAFDVPVVLCDQIKGGRRLLWTVVAPTRHFAQMVYQPSLSQAPWGLNSISNLLYMVSSACLFFFAAFIFFAFRGKVEPERIGPIVGTCVFMGLHFAFFMQGIFGSSLNFVINQSLGNIALVLGSLFLTKWFVLQELIHPRVFTYIAIVSALALPFSVFCDTLETVMVTQIFVYQAYMFALGIVLVRATVNLWRQASLINSLIFTSYLAILITAFNDMGIVAGLLHSFNLFPLGMIFFMLIQTIVLRLQLGEVFSQRDQFKSLLEASYREKLELIQKNVVAHAIANTTQMIAHDLKHPFSLLQLVGRQIKSKGASEKLLTDCAAQIEKTVGYVDNLLANLMLPGHAANNRLEPVELGDLVNEVWELCCLGREGRFRLRLDCEEVGALFVDRAKVERLFSNLFINAMQAMPTGARELWVTARVVSAGERRFAEVTLGNEQTFIPGEECARLFERFYTRGKADGHGLGLAICYEVVINHGGTIRCESSRDKGTEFIFTLPLL